MNSLLHKISRNFHARGFHVRRLFRISWMRTASIALRFPTLRWLVLFSRTRVRVRGTIGIRTNCVVAFNEPWFFASAEPGTLIVSRDASLVFGGSFDIKSGAFVEIKDGGQLYIAGGGFINRWCNIECTHSINIGTDCAIGSHVTIRDSDGHHIDGRERDSAPIKIEDNVWIGDRAIILKGTRIGAGSIVAAGSVVSGVFPPCSLIAGVPARVRRSGVSWAFTPINGR